MFRRNNKRNDRKGGKFSYKWLGPFVVSDIAKTGLATLKNNDGKLLKTKYNIVQLKPIFDKKNHCINDEKPAKRKILNPGNKNLKHFLNVN